MRDAEPAGKDADLDGRLGPQLLDGAGAQVEARPGVVRGHTAPRSSTGRQPIGVRTAPIAKVSPVGSLSTGPSCGPIRNPSVATSGTPVAAGVSMIGAPSTTTTTQEPVGAMRSRR